MFTGLFQNAKLLRIASFSMLLVCYVISAKGQFFDLESGRKRVTIPFRMVRQLVIITLKINNKGPFNFVLDTGVGLMLITDPKLVDSINIVNKRTLKITGLGEANACEAYITPVLNIDIPGLVSYDVAAAILKKDPFNLSSYAGLPVHGLIGYEFFNNLAVKIDFADSTISVSRPKDIRMFNKGSKMPISIEEHKPYINAKITLANGIKTTDKLIVDLGAGHPLSLENVIDKHELPQKFISANLGVGLTGPIEGYISRINEIELGHFKVKQVLTSFPDDRGAAPKSIKRDGNLGVGVLKRFTIIIDYPDSAIYLKPAQNFTDVFEHDMSGLEYYAAGDDFKRIIISRVEPGSAGDAIGLEKDDEILAINFKPVGNMTLEQIDEIFKSRNDRSLLLDIYHDKKYDRVILTLKRRI